MSIFLKDRRVMGVMLGVIFFVSSPSHAELIVIAGPTRFTDGTPMPILQPHVVLRLRGKETLRALELGNGTVLTVQGPGQWTVTDRDLLPRGEAIIPTREALAQRFASVDLRDAANQKTLSAVVMRGDYLNQQAAPASYAVIVREPRPGDSSRLVVTDEQGNALLDENVRGRQFELSSRIVLTAGAQYAWSWGKMRGAITGLSADSSMVFERMRLAARTETEITFVAAWLRAYGAPSCADYWLETTRVAEQ